jgi:hypothetical protein
MSDSETEEDGWEGGSGNEEQSEEGDDQVQVMTDSVSHVSVKPILWSQRTLVERSGQK